MPANEGIPEGVRSYCLLAIGDTVLVPDYDNGRFFRTVDHGATWTAVAPDGFPAAFAWIATTSGVQFAAGTRSDPFVDDVFRSEDSGATWELVGVLGDPPDGDYVDVLLETAQGTLLAGAGWGGLGALPHPLYRSPDGGETWLPASAPSGWGSTLDFVQTPDGVLYAAHFGGIDGGVSGISRSFDDGATWLPALQGGVGVMALAALPDGTLLASRVSGGSAWVWRSVDGVTWEEVPEAPNNIDGFLVVGDDVLAYRGYEGGGLFVSSDGGLTWEEGTSGIEGLPINAVTYDASGYVYAATTEGIYRSMEPFPVPAEPGPVLPSSLSLTPVHPNPAGAAATITYALAVPEDIELAVYDMLGKRVAVLATGRWHAGRHVVSWDAGAYPSGVYVVRLMANGAVQSQPLVVAR